VQFGPAKKAGEGGKTMEGHNNTQCDATGCCCEVEVIADRDDDKTEAEDEESEAEINQGEEN
jgi:hypothetical protein